MGTKEKNEENDWTPSVKSCEYAMPVSGPWSLVLGPVNRAQVLGHPSIPGSVPGVCWEGLVQPNWVNENWHLYK